MNIIYKHEKVLFSSHFLSHSRIIFFMLIVKRYQNETELIFYLSKPHFI